MTEIYTKAEWRMISESVQVVRKGELPKQARTRLIEAALDYRSGLEAAQQRMRCRKRTERLRKIARHAIELMEEISAEAERFPDVFWKVLQAHAAQTAFMASGLGKENNDRVNPRLLYQARVLECWVFLGGELKISRHSKSKKVQGPLARYFFAVTRPVMGASTPSPETLPDIVDRQKRSMGETKPLVANAKWRNIGAAVLARIRATYVAELGRQERMLEREIAIARKLSGDDQPAVIAPEHALSHNGDARTVSKSSSPH
jgi:hypothetical protein